MFNFAKKKTTTIEAKVLFHKDVNGKVEHGVLCAEHKKFNLTKTDPVRFMFDGIEPPEMTPEVLSHIFDQAERQGYVVYHLHSYATVLTVKPSPVLRPRNEQPAPVLMEPRTGEPRGVARTVRRPSGDRANVRS